jgi:hypothetical protein
VTRAYHCPCGNSRDANTGACRDCDVTCLLCERVISRAGADVMGRLGEDGIEAYCRDSDACVNASLERARISAMANARILGLTT